MRYVGASSSVEGPGCGVLRDHADQVRECTPDDLSPRYRTGDSTTDSDSTTGSDSTTDSDSRADGAAGV
ncbi:hypothetical protein C1I93_30175 [Micromonospora endophytica]|uniref:Uncharacterized protein n=1 Tax=Micromonospora endophytica TaxID=515350 RepID=A0A2W2C4S9_9ACTN|nr:hypothetical protein C1I93_30175 [Micromonospora endophytica]RIW45998.1 hypothetical protein D3H59_13325 [Micromonospora endophytica]